MAMGKRARDRQATMWVATADLPTAASHPFYAHLNQLLREHGFDDFAEAQCAECYADGVGLLVHASGFNLGLFMRTLTGIGTPRSLQGRAAAALALCAACFGLMADHLAAWRPR